MQKLNGNYFFKDRRRLQLNGHRVRARGNIKPCKQEVKRSDKAKGEMEI